MPVEDFVARVKRLVKIPSSALADLLSNGAAEWDEHKENTARLLEIESFKLDLEWSSRTVDPNDPQVRRDRLEAERNGIKPPPHPLIPPIAVRPAVLAEARYQAYLDQVAQYQAPKREREQVGTDEFDAALGLT